MTAYFMVFPGIHIEGIRMTCEELALSRVRIVYVPSSSPALYCGAKSLRNYSSNS
jgi:hypothetical protein